MSPTSYQLLHPAVEGPWYEGARDEPSEGSPGTLVPPGGEPIDVLSPLLAGCGRFGRLKRLEVRRESRRGQDPARRRGMEKAFRSFSTVCCRWKAPVSSGASCSTPISAILRSWSAFLASARARSRGPFIQHSALTNGACGDVIGNVGPVGYFLGCPQSMSVGDTEPAQCAIDRDISAVRRLIRWLHDQKIKVAVRSGFATSAAAKQDDVISRRWCRRGR